MAIVAPAVPRHLATNWARRAAPVAVTAAVGVAALLVWRNDPAAPGSHFPGCLFHEATGLWCPGCGLTRGMHALLNGHIGTALGENLLTPFVAIAIVWALAGWLLTAWGRRAPRLPRSMARVVVVVAPIVVVAFGVARNVPVAPLRGLAP